MQDTPTVLTVVGVLAVVAFVLLGIGLALLRRLLGILRRVLIAPLAPLDSITVLAALVLALAYEPSPFLNLLRVAFGLVGLLLFTLPAELAAIAPNLAQACRDGVADLPNCVASGANSVRVTLARNWVFLIGSQPFEASDAARAVVVFGMALLSVLLLRRLAAAPPALPRPPAATLSRIGAVLGVTVFLGGALFLAVSAIIAIPIFSDRATNLDEARSALERDLRTIVTAYETRVTDSIARTPPSSTFDLAEVEALPGEMDAEGREAAAAWQQIRERSAASLSMPEFALGVLNIRARILRNDVAALRNAIEGHAEATTALIEAQQRFSEQAGTLMRRMRAAFEEQNPGRVGGQLTLDHVARLTAQMENATASFVSGIDACRAGLALDRRLFSQSLTQLARYADISRAIASAVRAGDSESLTRFLVSEGLISFRPGPREPGSVAADGYSLSLRASGSALPDLGNSDVCQQVGTLLSGAQVAQRPDPGAGLGIFGQAAGWLLRTQSRDLALITGLLGFGFFGAMSTTFIRQIAAGGGQPVTPAAWIVPALIRGIAAAMLVFLAVLGGISVFTQANPPLNAYAVFLSCFIAAVFSEDVWDWARRRQQEQFARDRGAKASPESTSQPGASSTPARSV
ncbi:hypothetical protein [Falsiroseomonas oryzae]|uniref:hypothetical protein n=1 Tax=Falsiroseomonas oryzae TaxID=2766473 RepID=UPI0022EB399F|nr:hypothetical protein [Roseomonas sp. MO-31]